MGRKASVAPFVDGTIPTTLDKKLAPEGTHVFSMFTQWVPDDWTEEPHREELDAYAKRIFDLYDELAPNFKDSIIDYQVIGPYDMEQDLGLIGGNIFHGELSVDQLFHMRPAPGYADYRTPLARPVSRLERHARRRRRERDPRLAGVPHGEEGPAPSGRSSVRADPICPPADAGGPFGRGRGRLGQGRLARPADDGRAPRAAGSMAPCTRSTRATTRSTATVASLRSSMSPSRSTSRSSASRTPASSRRCATRRGRRARAS